MNKDKYRTPPDSSATPVFLANADEWLACFYLQDQIKPEAPCVIKALKQRYPLTLASGDNEQTVAAVAQQLDLERYLGRCAPEAKTDLIQNAQAKGRQVLMVGDGANDGPVLAQADVGIAMGHGAALAHASADIILLTSDLRALPTLLAAVQNVHRIIRQNLLWAIVYNFIALPFAAAGLVPAWAAAIGMSCSSLAVVLNSLRLVSGPNPECSRNQTAVADALPQKIFNNIEQSTPI